MVIGSLVLYTAVIIGMARYISHVICINGSTHVAKVCVRQEVSCMSHKRSMNVPQATENAVTRISGTKVGAPPGSVGSDRALTSLASLTHLNALLQ